MLPIIQVEALSKRYRITHEIARAAYSTLRESITSVVTVPWQRLRSSGVASVGETFWAIKDVSFDVRQGEVVGVIGRNGAGKSTLLKILSRITKPSSGRAVLRGRVASLLEVGTGFHQELTGRENIFLNGAILGMTRAEIRSKFDEIVAFAEVDKFLDTPVKRYSSGMYVRLAFAIAAHLEPEVLIVDEVLAVGDAEFQKKCLGQMKTIAEKGRTVLFVSHQMNAVESLCDRVIWINQGEIKYDGAPRAAISHYINQSCLRSTWSPSETSDARDSPYFLPARLAAVDEDSKVLERPISNDRSVGIEIRGTLLSKHSALNLGFAIYSEDNSLLFWSLVTDATPGWLKERDLGDVSFVVWIPSRLLNEGDYRVELIVSLHFLQWIYRPEHNPPSIRFSIRGGLSDSPFWTAMRPGMLGPVLRFNEREATPSRTKGGD